MIIFSLMWMGLTLKEGIHLLTLATFINTGMGFFILWLLRKGRLVRAKLTVVLTAGCYYLIATMFPSGYGTKFGTAHFGFILLGIASCFLLYDLRGWREIIPAISLVLFFLFHFGYAPFYPLIVLPPERLFWVYRVDILFSIAVIYFTSRYFVVEISQSEEALATSADKLEGLVESMLPKNIATRLCREGRTFADEFYDCSVLFADIEGFTTWSANHSPNEVVERLNSFFSRFDDAVERSGLTKIKTMGDSYMVAAGIPEYRPDHAVVLTRLALALQAIAQEYGDFRFRIGINSGSFVAGGIWKKIFLYDLWGDTVNTASRLERKGDAGHINIGTATYELIREHSDCTYRGKFAVRNKGEPDMYFVDGPR